MAKKELFLSYFFTIEIRTLSSIMSLKCAEFLVLTEVAVLGASPVTINRDERVGF